MGLFDMLAEVIAAPLTLPIKAVALTVKAAESLPDLANSVIEKVSDAIDKVGE